MAKQEIGMTTTQGFIDPTVKTYTPLLSEILTKVNNAKNKLGKHVNLENYLQYFHSRA